MSSFSNKRHQKSTSKKYIFSFPWLKAPPEVTALGYYSSFALSPSPLDASARYGFSDNGKMNVYKYVLPDIINFYII